MHLVSMAAGGIVGAILTGVFQSQHVNNDVSNGLIYTGDVHSVLIQILVCYRGIVLYHCFNMDYRKNFTENNAYRYYGRRR